MKIRALNTNQDIVAFKAIRIEGVLDSPESFRASPEEMENKTIEDFENQISGLNKGDFFVGAFLDDDLIGVAALYHEAPKKLAHKCMIGSVYVKPQHRNIGVAKNLLNEIVRRVRVTGGVRQINLSVITSNKAAIRLYESLGFVCYGTEPNAVYVNGNYYDEHLMQLLL